MNDDQLQFDRTCHVIYSKPCKAEIREKIAHLGARADAVCRLFERLAHRPWREEKLSQRPGRQLRLHRADGVLRRLQGRDKPSRDRGDGGNLFLPSFRKLSKLKFIDINKPLCKKLLHRAFLNAKKQCDKWGDFEMHVAPFDKDQPIYYEFTACPTAEFAKKHDLLEVMPALCNPDFAGMELIHARLIRKTTCSNGCKCD